MFTFTVDHTPCDLLGQTLRGDVGDILPIGAQQCLSAASGLAPLEMFRARLVAAPFGRMLGITK
jgi:hypothetical protein